MKTVFRYNQRETGASRPARGFVRWLGFWLLLLARLLRRGTGAGPILWAEDRPAELLAAGFPSLLAVPGELFAALSALFPEELRLRAEGSEEELLAAIRRVEERFGERFDWDLFLAACERQNRRANRLHALAEALGALAPPSVDARTPRSALRSLQKEKE